MFDIGWTEMLVIAVIMIVIVGPKDLPKMLRTFGRTTAKLRSMAGDFQKQFNDALKEAELDDVKKSVDSLRSLNPANEIKKQLNPFEKAAADVRAGLDKALKPTTPATGDTAPAASAATAAASTPASAEPASSPVVSGPTEMPPPPVFTAPEPAPAPQASGISAPAKVEPAKPAPAKRAATAKKTGEKAKTTAAAAPVRKKKTGSPT